MICSRCSALPFHQQDWDSDRGVRHHPTFAELDELVQNGCKVCTLFRTVLFEYYARGLFSSIEEAANYHRQLDESRETETNERTDPDESALQGECGFWVKAVVSDTVSDSTPKSHGIRGFLYLRYHEGELDPIDRIYPFVEVTSLPGV